MSFCADHARLAIVLALQRFSAGLVCAPRPCLDNPPITTSHREWHFQLGDQLIRSSPDKPAKYNNLSRGLDVLGYIYTHSSGDGGMSTTNRRPHQFPRKCTNQPLHERPPGQRRKVLLSMSSLVAICCRMSATVAVPRVCHKPG